MPSALVTRVAVVLCAAVASFLVLKLIRTVEARTEPRPYGLRIGSTTCADAMKRAGVQWTELRDWSGSMDSAVPHSLSDQTMSVRVTCRKGRLDALAYSARPSSGPDGVGPELVDQLLASKWSRVKGQAISPSACGETSFEAGRIAVSIDARPACQTYTVVYLRRRPADTQGPGQARAE